ncbi:MAG: cytochrome c biogenesis protein ResB [Gemmataceae bacterium]|nr:cytochrome c biogenesis protein ResB [Gemmataceae bacterium]
MNPSAIREGLPTNPATAFTADSAPPTPGPRVRTPRHPLLLILDTVASLRLTVILFALSLVLVFYGTWAQKELGTWTAVNSYFRSAIAYIPLRVLLFYTVDAKHLPAITIPYPGGWLLGGLLLANVIAAHIVRFKATWRRSGVLILHAGLILMMLGELVTGIYAVEGHMSIRVGESSNFIEHNDRPEIAFVKKMDAEKEEVVAVPGHLLREALTRGDGVVQHPDLPVDIKVKSVMKNSKLIDKFDPAANLATKGEGTTVVAVDKEEGAGAASSQVDVPSVYVSFFDKKTGAELGTWLMSIWLNDAQPLTVDGATYDVSLRFKRSYKPYTIALTKFEHKKFVGTPTPKDFRAHIDLRDAENKVEMKGLQVYMNNPLTYRGETFYQSAVLQGDSGTVFQVVRNPGWVLPYLSCLMVSLGMLFHFGIHLVGFLEKTLPRAAAIPSVASSPPAASGSKPRLPRLG